MWEAKKKGEVDVPIEPMDLSAPDINVVDEWMDVNAADVVETKKRRAGDVAGGKGRLRRQVKTATIENTTEPALPPPASSSSFGQPQFYDHVTAVVEPFQPADFSKMVEQALMDPRKVKGSTTQVVCPGDPLSNGPGTRSRYQE